MYTVKKLCDFPILSRDVTNQTLPGREQLNYTPPGRVWLVTSQLGTGKSLTFLQSTEYSAPDSVTHQQVHCHTQHIFPLFHYWSADYSKPYSDSFGNFLRQPAFALASTFLYAVESGVQRWSSVDCWMKYWNIFLTWYVVVWRDLIKVISIVN
jgi:hypothetical protein